jgi:hypothetical protein
MIGTRLVVTLGGLASALVISCTAPTEPSAAAARFAELRHAPAWTRGAARDSAFATEIYNHRQTFGGISTSGRVARSSERWTTLWDTVVVYKSPKPPLPPVNFVDEMLVLAMSDDEIDIVHVTRQRDTTFVLVRTIEPGTNCFTGAGSGWIDARVVPVAPPPSQFVVERNVRDCVTGRVRPVW